MSEKVPLNIDIDISQAIQALDEVEGGLSDIRESVIDINADGSSAESSIDGVSDSLNSLEGVGAEATTTINDSFNETAESATKLNGSADILAGTMSSASSVIASFQGPLGPIAGRLSSASSAVRKFSKGIKGATASTKAFTIALAATGIGLIVIALGALVAAFTSTQRGQDALTRALEPLKFLFSTFIGLVQQLSFFLVDKLKAAFESPKQAVIDLGNAIRQNIENRFKALISQAKGLGTVLQGLFSFDLDQIKEGATQAAKATVDLITGVEGSTDKIAGYFNDIKAGTQAAIKAGREIADLEIELDKLRLGNITKLAQIRAEEEALITSARDLSKTDEEREQALVQAIKLAEQRKAIELEELQIQQALLEAKAEANDTDRNAQREIEETKKQIIELETNFQRETRRSISLLSGLRNKTEEISKDIDNSAISMEMLNEQIAKDLEIEFDVQLPLGSIAFVQGEIARLNEEINLATRDAERERLGNQKDSYEEQLKAYKQTADGIKKTAKESTEAELAFDKTLAMGQINNIEDVGRAVQDAIRSAIKARLSEAIAIQIAKILSSVPFPFNIGLAAGAGAIVSGLFNRIPKFAKGGSFITNGATPIMVGDNQGGRERVDITPISSTNFNGPKGNDVQAFENALNKVQWEFSQKTEGTTIVNVVRKTLKTEGDLGGRYDL